MPKRPVPESPESPGSPMAFALPHSPRRVLTMVLVTVLGYVALWDTGTLGVLTLSYWARQETPPPAGARAVQGIRHFQPVDAQERLWRGSAPSPAGYRALAGMGVHDGGRPACGGPGHGPVGRAREGRPVRRTAARA
ncbi:hypothetical protein [Streptomyces sp. GbtcB6]|uniref:hypothetical protein n=1 Tax=Streptomyces sp. GbtcB6 TaxID=2824751 RepID=UPI0020C6CC70|nr:hypothetical protein [Streptomyces sp. GbtcB6]